MAKHQPVRPEQWSCAVADLEQRIVERRLERLRLKEELEVRPGPPRQPDPVCDCFAFLVHFVGWGFQTIINTPCPPPLSVFSI